MQRILDDRRPALVELCPNGYWQTHLVLFKARFWAGIRDGSLTVAYRRWKRPSVRAGGTLQSPGGLLAIDSVEIIDVDAIDDDDAAAAGYDGRSDLLANLRSDGDLYRIRFHRVGDDPRVGMRQRVDLSPQEDAAIARLLKRNDWAVPYLGLIAEMPATVSTELAARVGIDRPTFKQRVRRLKALGLTQSLEVGYRLSPRGEAVLAEHHPPV
jgi:hypothetical protein